MPVTPSAKKALRNARAKHGRNTAVKTELKRALKTVSPAKLSAVVSLVDKAAKRQIIHANKAARLKSRLAKLASTPAVAAKLAKKTTARKARTRKVANK